LKRGAGKITLVLSGCRMRDFCFYLFYRAGFALLAVLPLGLLFRLGQVAGFCAWIILPQYRKLALDNCSIAFGREKSPRELRRLVRRHFQRLGANILSSLKLSAMPAEKLSHLVEVGDTDLIDRDLRAGRPVVCILSHLGNWELFARMMPKLFSYARISTVYQKLGNPYIDNHVRRARARDGVELFERGDGFQRPLELLRHGGGIGVLSDQHAGDQGLWVPFFGRLASTSSLPALLAKRTGAAIVAAALYTNGPAKWRMVLSAPARSPDDSIESLTAKINAVLENQVGQAPEDWFWVHNRWKTPRPNFLLTQYKRGVYLPPELRAQDLKPFRILIRASNWLGDAVMSIPAVRAIKRGRPDAHVTVATPKRLAPVWKLVPEVDTIISLPRKSLFRAVRLIERESKFDVAILFPNSLRAALEIWLADIPRRVGCRGHFRSALLNQIVREPRKPGAPEHHAKRFLRMAEQLGAAAEQKTFNAQRSTLNAQPIKLGLCPGAEYGPAKRWLPERFIEVATAIAAEKKVQWILFGTAKDAPVGEQIVNGIGDSCVNRIGQTTLAQLIDELRACRLLLTNDTGTMHLAALLGVPTVSIFGSTEPALTGPLGTGHVILRHHVECSPCFLRECPIDFRCMKAVSVEEARQAVMSILRPL
jgi:heptosyltransferase II